MTITSGASAPRSIAVIGSGVAGLTAAYVLSSAGHRVTLIEADDRLGGHAHTHAVTTPSGRTLAVDSGFIVHNDRTYPVLQHLFADLGIATQETDMSMSVYSERTGLCYAGSRGLSGLFPTPRNLTRPRYLRMLGEITRFHRAARRLLDTPDSDEPLTEFLAREHFSPYFRENFLLPLVAAVWSCDTQTAADYPARYLFTFLDHHGMLSVFGSPTWRTVVDGSVTYVDAIAGRVRAGGGEIALNSPVRLVRETAMGVQLTLDGRAPQTFDDAVIATHPHQALAMLEAPTRSRRRILGQMPYLPKQAVLHTDSSIMPTARQAHASWNYRITADDADVAVTYDLTRLMRLPTDEPRMLVTLGRTDLVDPRTVIAEMTYEHPVYTTESVAAQAQLPEIDSAHLVFAGAYHGWGFHEDGAASGVRAAARLGVDWPATAEQVPV